MHKLLLSS